MRAAILLAAGRSQRFGRADKLRARLHGKTLFEHALDNARASGSQRVIVIGGPPLRCGGRIRQIRSARSRSGLGGSLSAALAVLRPVDREIIIFLADMPFARLRRLRLRFDDDGVRPGSDGVPGHPVLVRRRTIVERNVDGDEGLSTRLRGLRVRIVAGNAGNILDVDTPAALRALRMRGSGRLERRS
jgi:molybdenum cofactor cytidylyltransferase